MAPSDLIQSGDVTGIFVLGIFVLITGGVGSAVVNAIAASRRGVKGDALQKEINVIARFDSFTAALQKDYTRISEENTELRKRLDKIEAATSEQIESLKSEILHWREEAESAVEYSNILIRTLHENTIEIPHRPIRAQRKRE